jgi:hypothetical protein
MLSLVGSFTKKSIRVSLSKRIRFPIIFFEMKDLESLLLSCCNLTWKYQIGLYFMYSLQIYRKRISVWSLVSEFAELDKKVPLGQKKSNKPFHLIKFVLRAIHLTLLKATQNYFSMLVTLLLKNYFLYSKSVSD